MVAPLKFLNLITARQAWALLLLACIGPLGFALYLQHVVGLEPCPMCAGALYWAQLGELYLGAKDPKRGYRQCNTHMLHPKTKVTEGLLEKESEQLLLDFFQGLRKKSL